MVCRAGGIGGNVPVSQDNQSLFCKVCGTGPEYSSAPNPESLADNGKLAEKAVDISAESGDNELAKEMLV